MLAPTLSHCWEERRSDRGRPRSKDMLVSNFSSIGVVNWKLLIE